MNWRKLLLKNLPRAIGELIGFEDSPAQPAEPQDPKRLGPSAAAQAHEQIEGERHHRKTN